MSRKGSVRWTVGSYNDAYDLLAFLRTAVDVLGQKKLGLNEFSEVALRRQRWALDRLADSLANSIERSYSGVKR